MSRRVTFRVGLLAVALGVTAGWPAVAEPLSAVDRWSPAVLREVGRRIWENESAASYRGLTAWNRGEAFASLGIGHFIWYPESYDGPFEESFPTLVAFMRARGKPPPDWLAPGAPCPWEARSDFEAALDSPHMRSLRAWLAGTMMEQSLFIAHRLTKALPKILAATPARGSANVQRNFEALAADPRGLFALIDYVNFKGEGVRASERYAGEGWGLKQVLENMAADKSRRPIDRFVDAAIAVLERRVRNAPAARKEARWLPGWRTRLRRYR